MFLLYMVKRAECNGEKLQFMRALINERLPPRFGRLAALCEPILTT